MPHPASSLPQQGQQPAKGKIKSLGLLRGYLKPYRLRILAALIALAISSSIVLGLGSALRYLIDEGIDKNNVHLLDRSFEIFMGLTLLLALATYSRYYLVSWVGEKAVA